MSVTVPLTDEAERRLRERAEAAGAALDDYVARLVAHAASLPTPIDRLSGPLADRFHASGDTEQDLIDEIEEAKTAMRVDRHAGASE